MARHKNTKRKRHSANIQLMLIKYCAFPLRFILHILYAVLALVLSIVRGLLVTALACCMLLGLVTVASARRADRLL